MPTHLDRFLQSHSLLSTLIEIYREVSEWWIEEFWIMNTLPNSCRSIMYCLMVAYQKWIYVKWDRSQCYLSIDPLYRFLRWVENPFIKDFTTMYDSCQILSDYGLIKESLRTHNPRFEWIKMKMNLQDVQDYFTWVSFVFASKFQ